MKSKIYIVADRRGLQRMTKKVPDLFRGELAIAVSVVIPDSAFREPILNASLEVPEEAVIHPAIEVQVEQSTVPADKPEDQIDICESCGKFILEGQPYYMTADGCCLCADHAPMLSDSIAQYEKILAADLWEPGELMYETRDEMSAALAELKNRLATSGDYNLATGNSP